MTPARVGDGAACAYPCGLPSPLPPFARASTCLSGRSHYFLMTAMRVQFFSNQSPLAITKYKAAITVANTTKDKPSVSNDRLTPAFPRSVGLGPVFFPPAAPWSSPRPSSASPNQCPSVHRTVRRRPASVSGTRQRRPDPESDHTPWMWRTGPSRSTPLTDNSAAIGHAGTTAAKPIGCSRGPAGVGPAQPTGRPRCESRSWSCCLVCTHACAWMVIQYPYG